VPILATDLWLDRPLAGAFLAFNLLPAGLVHPSRIASWQLATDAGNTAEPMPAPQADNKYRLRHASMALLKRFGTNEAVVTGFSDLALPVFMASQAAFERLTLYAGLVCLIPSIRKIIAREDLQVLRDELSASEFEFVRRGGDRWVTQDMDSQVMVTLGQVRPQARALGYALLFSAIAPASPAVACRARLRLPLDLSPESSSLPQALRDGDKALGLARGLLQELDAEWMSLFPNSS
jgi:hypothetical protein